MGAREGGCGEANHTRHFLEGPSPAVFTMQLVWESQNESSAVIAQTLEALQESIDLGVSLDAHLAKTLRIELSPRGQICGADVWIR